LKRLHIKPYKLTGQNSTSWNRFRCASYLLKFPPPPLTPSKKNKTPVTIAPFLFGAIVTGAKSLMLSIKEFNYTADGLVLIEKSKM